MLLLFWDDFKCCVGPLYDRVLSCYINKKVFHEKPVADAHTNSNKIHDCLKHSLQGWVDFYKNISNRATLQFSVKGPEGSIDFNFTRAEEHKHAFD